MANSIIIGAGKIGRGFLAQMLYRSNEPFCFIEKSIELADEMNKRGKYNVYIFHVPERDIVVDGYRVYTFDDQQNINKKVSEADDVFTAIGGKNLPGIAGMLSKALIYRFENGVETPLNIITCENWVDPAKQLEKAVYEKMGKWQNKLDEKVGFAEAVIFCKGVENTEDPIDAKVENYYYLPIDSENLVAPLPVCPAIDAKDDFKSFLIRKFYTSNAANGTVSYLGNLKGYESLHDAADDPFIRKIMDGVFEETTDALVKEYGVKKEDQLAFNQLIVRKITNRFMPDTTERNARDPLRKLSPEDRLVGPMRIALRQGIVPENLATVLAAALYYKNPDDASANKLAQLRKEKGIEYILETVSGINKDDELYPLIQEKLEYLKKEGLIKDE